MSKIVIDKQDFDELMAVTRWYEATPSTPHFYAGDRLHERVFDFQMNMLPEGSYDSDEVYVSHVELVGDRLFVFLGNQDDGLVDDDGVEIVSKG